MPLCHRWYCWWNKSYYLLIFIFIFYFPRCYSSDQSFQIFTLQRIEVEKFCRKGFLKKTVCSCVSAPSMWGWCGALGWSMWSLFHTESWERGQKDSTPGAGGGGHFPDCIIMCEPGPGPVSVCSPRPGPPAALRSPHRRSQPGASWQCF